MTFLVVQTVKRLPTIWETKVRSLGWEDPLEEEMATHSSILAWGIPWMEEPGRLQPMGWQRIRHDRVTSLSLSLHLSIRPPVSHSSLLEEINFSLDLGLGLMLWLSVQPCDLFPLINVASSRRGK